MLNRAVLTGRLTRDVELRYTQSGKAVGSFTLAVDSSFKDKDGNKHTDFINCVIWGKSAESFANYMHKGSLTGVDGRIQTRSYDDKDGKKVYVTEVVIDGWTFLESKQESQSNGGYSNNQGGYGNQSNGYGNNQGGNYQPKPQSNDSIEVDDSELPF